MRKVRDRGDEPSAESLREMPEASFSKEKWERRPHYAERIAAEGMTFPGRGRPKRGETMGASIVRSIVLPKVYWKALQGRAKSDEMSIDAAIRVAIVRYIGRKRDRQREPSAASLREMPELDLTDGRWRPNPYAARIAAQGTELPGRRRQPSPQRKGQQKKNPRDR